MLTPKRYNSSLYLEVLLKVVLSVLLHLHLFLFKYCCKFIKTTSPTDYINFIYIISLYIFFTIDAIFCTTGFTIVKTSFSFFLSFYILQLLQKIFLKSCQYKRHMSSTCSLICCKYYFSIFQNTYTCCSTTDINYCPICNSKDFSCCSRLIYNIYNF